MIPYQRVGTATNRVRACSSQPAIDRVGERLDIMTVRCWLGRSLR